ncbi:3-oxoacyl-ACP reductase [Streptomyces spiroverticillatus]|uniref:3-oxoacyl-ACP reductase n=1 Tax=Streptomyces finlayi TaxID=67296 RepID=A0A918WUQ7_9ACTN|nr:SDR family oxidoreductase [Streptomyces finlayi]GHA01541.1 3-oxoacyl-ACP reductase [Streptomyces spiroverticillatus]GHC85930.1 3-oxoacyl-ACP reductase [Streptomyces finlayi]
MSTTITTAINRTALVTGGSRGMGAAIALRLAQDGTDVAITYVEGEQAAQDVVRKIEAVGRRALAVRMDAADPESVTSAVAAVADTFGRLDVLVNNAGIGVLGPVESLTLADVDRVLAVNVRAVFLASQAAASVLEDGGRIISTGSALTRYAGGPGGSLYAMSKSALTGLTKALAREVGDRGITVNLIHPGAVDTDMNPADGPFAEPQRANTAIGRFGRPDEVASLVSFLAGDEGAYMTGAELVMDGGHAA